MRAPLPHPVRAHGRGLCVVVVLLAVLFPLTRPAGAAGSPVDPVPIGVWPLQPRPVVVRAFDPPILRWGAGTVASTWPGRSARRSVRRCPAG